MSSKAVVGLVAVALLAGAVGGLFASSSAGLPGQADVGLADSDAGSADQHVGAEPTGGARGESAYTEVYRETIDSVVMLEVIDGGGVAQGSGFVYDERGYVLTNQHVVADATRVQVRFQRGDWRTGRVVGTDAYTDLAVVRVETLPAYADPLPVADRQPVTGQLVAALGSPFGLEGSITSGIVSGVNRSMRTAQGFAIPATVQTDAPINPGNSGGPLVALDGTVVGVNRAKEGDNVGFAISPLVVHRVVPRLIESGEYHHSYVGIRTLPVTPAVEQANDLDAISGVLVVEVLPDGPATGSLHGSNETVTVEGADWPTGGDVIVAVGGEEVTTGQDLSRYLMLHTKPGDTVPFTVIRDGDRTTVEVTLGERPSV